MKNIYIAGDHAAIELKKVIGDYLSEKGYTLHDLGPFEGEKADYPEYASKVANEVLNNNEALGILICGTGVGISIAANKHKGIRAVVCSEPYSAKLSKMHNNTNILCFGARVVGTEMAKEIVDAWLIPEYEGDRHQKRLDMITDIENM